VLNVDLAVKKAVKKRWTWQLTTADGVAVLPTALALAGGGNVASANTPASRVLERPALSFPNPHDCSSTPTLEGGSGAVC